MVQALLTQWVGDSNNNTLSFSEQPLGLAVNECGGPRGDRRRYFSRARRFASVIFLWGAERGVPSVLRCGKLSASHFSLLHFPVVWSQRPVCNLFRGWPRGGSAEIEAARRYLLFSPIMERRTAIL